MFANVPVAAHCSCGFKDRGPDPVTIRVVGYLVSTTVQDNPSSLVLCRSDEAINSFLRSGRNHRPTTR